MRSWRNILLTMALGLCSAPVWAIGINNETTTRNNRFTSGYTSGPLLPNTDPTFIGAGYDWSGTGWLQSSGGQSYGLLTPRQMVIANHYQPNTGNSVNIVFASSAGTTSVTVQTQPGTHSFGVSYAPDLATAQFSAPLPQTAGVTPSSILFLGYTTGNYAGLNMLQYGQTAAVGWNKIDAVNTGTLLFPGNYGSQITPDAAYYMRFLYDNVSADRTLVQGGDSGSPSFIATGSPGVMYLAGGHYLDDPGFGSAGAAYDTFLPLSLPMLDGYTAPAGYLPSVVTPTTARWTGTSSTSWNTAANWSTNVIPNDVLTSSKVTTCASVLFDASTTSQRSIALNGNLAATSLAFNLAPSATSGFTIVGTSGQTLTLGEAGITNRDVHTQTFNGPLALRTSQQWHAGLGGLNISTTGTLNLGANQLLYLDGSGNSDFEGLISGSGSSGIAKDGSGTLILGNAGNAFAGPIFVHNGTLQFNSINNLGGSSALGAPTTAANGTIYVAGTLAYVGGGHTSNRIIDIADGPGAVGATGAIDASGGGALTLTGGITTENFNASYSGTSTVVLQGSGSGSSSGGITNNSPNILSLVKSGSGTWTLTGSGVNNYSGATAIGGGLLTIGGSAAKINSTSGLTVSRGTIQLDDSTGNSGTRLAANMPIALQGGTMNFNVGNTTSVVESFGTLSVAQGENTLAIAALAGSSTVTGVSLNRTPGATLNFTGPLGSGNRFAFSSTATIPVNPGLFANGADYAVYDAGGYMRAMVSGTNDFDFVSSATASRHVKLTSAASGQASVSLQTLNLSGTSSGFSLSTSQTLTLALGGLLKSGGGTATVDGGLGLSTSGEYVLRVDAAADQLNINTPLNGGSGLTKSGLGTLSLGGSTASAYGGTTTIDAGTIKLAAANVLPATSNILISNGAILDLNGQSQTVAGLTLNDGLAISSSAGSLLTLAGSSTGMSYTGGGWGSTLSGGTLNLASTGAASGTHIFAVARGQGSIDLIIAANIADGSTNAQTLQKTGPGILQLASTNGYSGGTQVSGGTLLLGIANALPAASAVTVNGGTLNLANFNDTVASLTLQSGSVAGSTGVLTAASYNLQSGAVSAILAGTGAVSKTTAGAVAISGSNSYSGGTTIGGGTLSVTADANLGASGGTLTLDGGMLDVVANQFNSTTRSVRLNPGGGTLSIDDPTNTFLLGPTNLSGSGSLTKAGQGTLQLSGTLASSTISVQDGLLQLTGTASQFSGNPIVGVSNIASLIANNHNESFGGLNLSGGSINLGTGVLTLNGSLNYARSIWASAITGNLALGSSAGTFQVDASSYPLTLTQSISGSPTSGLVKLGVGILYLTGTNGYSGGTTITAGVLRANDGVGLSSSGVLTFNGGILESNGTASFTRSVGNSSGNVRFTANGGFSANGGKLTVNFGNDGHTLLYDQTFAGQLLFGSATANNETDFVNGIDLRSSTVNIVVTPGTGGDSAFLLGTISNSIGTAGIIKSGYGSLLVLTGSNTYNGQTFINGGTLQVGNGGTTGTLGTGPIYNNGETLAFNRSDNITVPGDYAGGGNVIKNGAGALIMTGDDSGNPTFTINLGTLQFGNGGTTGSPGSGPINLGANTKLIFNRSNSSSYSGNISGTGSVTQLGTGTTVLGGVNSYTKQTQISGGALRASFSNGLGAANLLLDGGVLEGSGTFNRQIGPSLNSGFFQWSTNGGGFSAFGGTLTVQPNGGSQLAWGAGTSNIRGPLLFGSTTANNETDFVNAIDLAAADRTIQVTSGTGGDKAVLQGVISNSSGTAGVAKTGAGLLIFTGSNTYNGTTTISGGALRAAIGSGIPTASRLVLNGGVIEGSGSLTRALSASGTNTIQWGTTGGGFSAYGGNLTVNLFGDGRNIIWSNSSGSLQGTLMFGSSWANSETHFVNPINLNGADHTIQVTAGTGGDEAVLQGVLTNSNGTAGIAKTGSGLLVLTGNNTYNGTTTINGGSLQVGSGTAAGTLGTGPVVDNVWLAFNRSDIFSVTNAISGTGGFVQAGTGTTILAGNDTYTGATAILNGVLQVGNGGINGSLGSGPVLDNTSLVFCHSDTIMIGGNINGFGQITQAGIGNLILTGSNTYTGTTTITAGTLQVGNGGPNGTLGTGLIIDNAALVFDCSGSVSVSNSIKGTGAVTQVGGGVLFFGVANSYGGDTTITAGTLRLGSAAAIPSGLSKGNLIDNSVLDLNGYSVSTNGLLGSGLVDNFGPSGVYVFTAGLNDASGTFSGSIRNTSGSIGLTKLGQGMLTLSGTNFFSGPTVVGAGVLAVIGGNALPNSTSLTVQNGGNLSTSDGIARGITVAALTLSGPASVTVDWNGSSVDLIATGTTAATSGNIGIALNPTNGPTGSNLTVIQAAGGLNSAAYFLANNTNFTATLTVSPTAVKVGSYASQTPLSTAYWYGGLVPGAANAMAFSASNGSTSNWSTTQNSLNAAVVVPGSTTNVVFSAIGASQQTNIVLGADMSVNSLTFNDAVPVTIANDGTAITLNSLGSGTSSAISANQNATINTAIILNNSEVFTTASGKTLTVGGAIIGSGGIVKNGSGKLVLSGTNTFYGGLAISAGTLELDRSQAVKDGSSVTVAAGATLFFGVAPVPGDIASDGAIALAPATGSSISELSAVVGFESALSPPTTSNATQSPANSVPEPSSLLLLLVAAVFFAVRQFQVNPVGRHRK